MGADCRLRPSSALVAALLEPQALASGCAPAPTRPALPFRYCTEGKRTFSSRLILEKHVQVRHGLPLGAQSPGRGSTLVRGPGARAQVGRGPAFCMSAVGAGACAVVDLVSGSGVGCQGEGGAGRPSSFTLSPRGRDGNAASRLTPAARSLTARHLQPSPPGVDLGREATDPCATGAVAQWSRASWWG